MTEHYDVVVAGGGSAGVAAAVGAAQTGARVLLVEAQGFLGGAATLSQVLAWCGFFPQRPAKVPQAVVAGAGRQALDHLHQLGVDVAPYYSGTGNWNIRLNPEATKIALDRTVADSKATLALHTQVVGVETHHGRIESLRLCDPRGLREVSADACIDTTGDAVLAFLAGAALCPLHATDHVQPASYPVRLGGVLPGAALDNPSRAAALKGIQHRFGRAEIRADGGFLTTLPGSADLWWLSIDVVTNGLDGTDLAQAEADGRAAAWHATRALRAGLTGFENAYVVATGPKIGIRETRHVATRTPLLQSSLAQAIRPDDTVALGAWPMEIHHGPGHTEYRAIGGDGVYGISLGALSVAGLDNLWLGGRTLGADAAAYASARVMGTAFATGQAAGVRATMRSDDIGALRRELLRQGALL
ncbi:FAD-dependent oxidoreductase [Sagittula sp. S175]|uniref:FAD-dependent oxidoreductase n=1 Tax=Sagittula sp. S175 TaxID=3415129 RepID=UPI003C7DEE9A